MKEYKTSQRRDDLRACADTGTSYAAGRLVGLAARDRQDAHSVSGTSGASRKKPPCLRGCFMGDPSQHRPRPDASRGLSVSKVGADGWTG
ncbi:hypothetical protein GCM10009733_007620 [Nonomuraea maheshkhaliensis]|uniref:Uncharacterized protein n=1 Tax=Nonomuraea maheshkhaliensis TaxID=419590 RepID=A0ABP4QJX5_9ACTN